MTSNYADDIMTNIASDGMTDDLWQLAQDDKSKFSELSITNDRERNLYFYLENFVDDLCEEFGYSIENADALIKGAFKKLRNKENVDLTDIRKAVFIILKKMQKSAANKKAYPNTRGTFGENGVPQRDINKWVQALGNIYVAVQEGENKEMATQRITEGWSPMEKFNFENWARYYEHGDYDKYGLNKSASPFPSMPKELQPQNISTRRGPGRPRKLIQSLEEKKRSLISRVDSAIRLLREFANVWPDDVWLRMMSSLNDLQAQIPRLRTEATMRDCIIRTAKRFEKEGFSEGASILIKVAQPPSGDIASKIEKALSGRKEDIAGPDETPAGGELPLPPGMEEMGELPPPPGMEEADMEAPPAGAGEELPAPESPPLAPPEEEAPKKETSIDENPFKNQKLTVQDVLSVLEPLAKKLSEREFVRALSKADMMLDSMNIASHFPELGEAQSKALELNIYVGTRIDKIINKLKGGLKGEGAEPEPPEIEMGEFAAEPGKEKEMFEVTEEIAPESKVPSPTGGGEAPPMPGV